MPNEITALTQLRDNYLLMSHQCVDAIKYLSGYTPTDSKFTFSIGSLPVLTIDISQEEDAGFCLGIFMMWHQCYARKLREVNAQIKALELA